MVKHATSSKVPALVDIDTTQGEMLVEGRKRREREEWRASVERNREKEIRAKEVRRQKERDEELTFYYIGDQRVDRDGNFLVSV